MSLFMKYSKFGTYCYALGGNKESAASFRIRVNRIQVSLYIYTGRIIFFLGRPDRCCAYKCGICKWAAYLFDVFTACVLERTALSGGIGRLPGVGCIFVGILNNGLVQLNVDSFYQMMLQELCFVIAVVLQSLLTRENA